MNEEAIKLEMRLSAIEFLLAKIHLSMVLQQGIKPEKFDHFAKEFVAGARNQRFGVDEAAVSDMLSGEWEEAIERLVTYEKEILAQLIQKGSGQQG